MLLANFFLVQFRLYSVCTPFGSVTSSLLLPCFFRWDISVIYPIILLKLTVRVFTGLFFRILWPNGLVFIGHFKTNSVWDRNKTSSGAHFRLLAPWTTQLVSNSQWMLHWWRVNDRNARELFPCTDPSTPNLRLDRKKRFSSLRYDLTGNRTQPNNACTTNCTTWHQRLLLSPTDVST